MLTVLKERIVSARQDDGLSLLEIVIAVAIIAVFLVAGVIGFQRLTDNARDTAVKSAAQQVYTAAAAELVGVGASDLSRVERDYNASADGVVVAVSGSDMDSLCVVAEYGAHSAERGHCVAVNPDAAPGDDDTDNDVIVVAAPVLHECVITGGDRFGSGKQIVLRWSIADEYSLHDVGMLQRHAMLNDWRPLVGNDLATSTRVAGGMYETRGYLDKYAGSPMGGPAQNALVVERDGVRSDLARFDVSVDAWSQTETCVLT